MSDNVPAYVPSRGVAPGAGPNRGITPGSVRIFDPSLRDGEQAPGVGLTVAEKVEVARQPARLNVDVIEASFPAGSPGEFEAVPTIPRETGGAAVAGLARCKDGDPGGDAFVATGHGLSTHIIEASVAAYLSGAEKLHQDAVARAAILESALATGAAPEKVEKLP